MSQGDPLAHLWPVLRDADLSFFISCAATTLAFYEHIITIRLEVQQIWKRDPSGATALFVMTRYFMLLNRIFAIIGLYPIRDPAVSMRGVSLANRYLTMSSCNTILWFQAVTTSALITVLSSIAAIRVYALWNRDIRLLALIMLMGVFPAFANLFFRAASAAYIIPTRLYTCQSAPVAMTAQAYKTLSIATRIISILSDGLVVVLTWMKTFRVYSLTRRVKLSADYSALILRDGTFHTVYGCQILITEPQGTNLLNDLIVTLSAILMARFLLNLRDQRAQLEEKAWPGESSSEIDLTRFSSSPMTSLCFRPGILDTMGGAVTVGSHESDDDMMDHMEEKGSAGHFANHQCVRPSGLR
ncbi:hypothetical protein C2E23DRAFT_868841 [Lenzites betulinus]|nr:hypothetical protein C2E23DRAFT_868841 [Lenzites betulinus]